MPSLTYKAYFYFLAFQQLFLFKKENYFFPHLK